MKPVDRLLIGKDGIQMTDLIDRQAAIDAIEEMQIPIMRSEFSEEQFVFTGMSEALRAIKDLPSAQPRKGKWIKENPYSGIYRYACSECYAHHRARYDFCPSCGADMREGDSDDN